MSVDPATVKIVCSPSTLSVLYIFQGCNGMLFLLSCKHFLSQVFNDGSESVKKSLEGIFDESVSEDKVIF